MRKIKPKDLSKLMNASKLGRALLLPVARISAQGQAPLQKLTMAVNSDLEMPV